MKTLRLTEQQLREIKERAGARGATVRENTLAYPGEGKPQKYRNRVTVAHGVKFDSEKEANRYAELRLLEQAGEITELERQVRFPLRVNGEEVCCYIADFTYRINGRLVVEDSKGVRTRDYVLKKKLMKALHRIEILET